MEIHPSPEHFRIQLQKSLATAKGPRRDELYVLSTVIWLAHVRSRSGEVSYYQLEKRFEPNARGKNAHGDPYHFNKWSKYASGLSRPSQALVAKVEESLRGSARLLYHPLWEILRLERSTQQQGESWIGRLSPDIQRVALEYNLLTTASGVSSKPMVVPLRMLERRAGIDSLAVISLLLRRALVSAEKTKEIIDIAQSLYRVLLITCITTPYLLIAEELFDCFSRRLLSVVSYDDQRLGLELIDFPESIAFLSQFVLQLEDCYAIGYSSKETNRGCINILDGRHGFNLRYGLLPPWVTAHIPDDIDPHEKWRREKSLRHWEWGRRTMRAGEIWKFPPRELFRFVPSDHQPS